MVVRTDSERVRTSRRLVLELLGSSVDLSLAPDALRYIEQYAAEPDRFGPPAPPADDTTTPIRAITRRRTARRLRPWRRA